jgi:mannose-6-phosphate isomerase-like protein (cupin superfamily)
MPVVPAPQAVVHEMHGSVFASYAAPASGSRELCAWRLEVPAGTPGVRHMVSREEVLFVLTGTFQVGLAGAADASAPDPVSAAAGDAIIVPAGSAVQFGNAGPGPASAWVTTSVGLQATLPDGTQITPPWVR